MSNLGQADEPVCWTLVGFASGYMSCVYGKEVIAIEDRCRGKGRWVDGHTEAERIHAALGEGGRALRPMEETLCFGAGPRTCAVGAHYLYKSRIALGITG